MICGYTNPYTGEGCDLPVRPGRRYCHAHTSIQFLEQYCTHIKGRWAGVPFNLIPWQRDLLTKAFGTLKPNGKRQYRTVYCEISKKNGKSELGSGIALIGLVGDMEFGGEVYSAAGDREQASLVYYSAAQMVRNNPTLSKRLKIIDSRKRIVDYQSNSFYQVLSAEAYTKHGLNPSIVIFDELHAQKTRELYDVLTEGTDIARDQQLILIITTAGIYDINSIGWEVADYARKVRDGIIEDPTFLPIIYAADKEKDDWESPETWKKTNPSLGHIFELDNLKTHYKQVKANPSRINNFQRFRLNLWVNQVSRYIPMDEWDVCDGKVVKKDLLKRRCYGGLDLSSTIDLTCFCLVFPPEKSGDKWKILPSFYVPEDNILERARKDNVPYDMWVRSGLIKATPGNVVDYSFIRKDVNNAAKIYDLQEVAFDPWGAVKLATELQDDDGITMVEFRQGFKSMSPPTKEMLKLIKGKEIAHGGHKVLRWCADNLVVKIDAAENVKPEKDKAKERIDGIVAMIMGIGRAILNADTHSVYEKRGVISF